MDEAAQPNSRRTGVVWGLSIVGAGLFLWLASTRLTLWPQTLTIESPMLLVAAAAVHVPYALVRALRLQYVFDPLVARADTASPRLDRHLLYGSGLVSFLVLLVLPLKLGELSRPVLLARGRQPGLGLTEAVGGVALERLVDGLIIVAMLFGGLAWSTPVVDPSVADVRTAGLVMLGIFGLGFAVLLVAARSPARAGAVARRGAGVAGAGAGELFGGIVERVANTMHGVLQLQRATSFVAWSLAYWAITAGQLWLVLAGCGIHLGPAAAAAIVAIVGLSIQLPGGPVQAGTFQVGTGLALSLYLDPQALSTAGSTFAAVMYVLQFAGAAVMALPGLWLLTRSGARGSRDLPDPAA